MARTLLVLPNVPLTTMRERGPIRTEDAYDDRALRRLRHRDAKGLTGLMDDYQSLADELETVGARGSDPGEPPSRRAA